MKFSLETMREIWNDEDGSKIEVGPDRDGLECIEIRYRNEKGIIGDRIMFPPGQAKLVAEAILACIKEKEQTI